MIGCGTGAVQCSLAMLDTGWTLGMSIQKVNVVQYGQYVQSHSIRNVAAFARLGNRIEGVGMFEPAQG